MTMPEPGELQEIIFNKLNLIKPEANRFSDETLLYASNGILNSIELVMLIVDVEQELRSKYKIAIVIASSKAMSQKNSPFHSVNSFTNFIFEELNIININTTS